MSSQDKWIGAYMGIGAGALLLAGALGVRPDAPGPAPVAAVERVGAPRTAYEKQVWDLAVARCETKHRSGCIERADEVVLAVRNSQGG